MAKSAFDEETPFFTSITAMEEASRCLLCLDAPCSAHCPAGTDPAKFIRSIRFKNVKGAAKTIRLNNPLGAICARVCPSERYCELGCSRCDIDRPIDIARLQRFATDAEESFGLSVYEPKAPNGKKVAIVGAGPAGLTAAATLALEGYEATIYEREKEAGGYLRYGIPEYRLPRRVLDLEIRRILSLGVKLRLSSPIEDVKALRDTHDAVIVADGFHKAKELPMFQGVPNVVNAIDFLRNAKEEDAMPYGHVLVIGGGDVAMDVATTCKKAGVAQVSDVVYETFSQFKASKAELELARKENVSIYDGFVPDSLGEDGAVNFKHRHQKIAISIKADLIVLAIGQGREDSALAKLKEGEGVFLCGDVAQGDKTVVHAVKTGKQAARNAMAYLGGK